jgi:hypothetical protein
VADATVIQRDYVIDLDELTHTCQSDGVTSVAYRQLPVDPFVFGGVGDQLITTVTFADHRYSTLRQVPGAHDRIVFDRYHIMSYMNEAADDVRKKEHRAYRATGDQVREEHSPTAA